MTPARHLRRGLTLIEIMVVMAIMALIAAVSIPAMSGLFDLQQRAGARELADTYRWLGDEAQLRNVTFRVAYNLDRGTWKVEVGDPTTLIFATPEERQAYEEKVEDEMSRYTQREQDEGIELDENGEPMTKGYSSRFTGLEDIAFTTAQTLPSGTRFAWVYTPQYGEDGIKPSDEPPDDPEEDVLAYTYIFPDGTAEHTVIRIVGIRDPEDGYTVQVSPIGGEVSLSTKIVDPTQSLAWVPDEGPTLR